MGLAVGSTWFGCGRPTPDVSSSTVIVQAVAALPSNVGSFRVVLNRTSGNAQCGSALTSLSGCYSGSVSLALANACSGQWVLDVANTQTFASTDCSGTALAATASLSPNPLTLGYASVGTVTISVQGQSAVSTDANFTTGATAPALAGSIAYRAQRTSHPDVAACGGAASFVSGCLPLTGGANPSPLLISSNGCSGSWIVCGQVFNAPGCAGAVLEQGVSAAQPVAFGSAATLSVTTQLLGPNCSF